MSLLVGCMTDRHFNCFLNFISFANSSIIVSPYSCRNTLTSVIRCADFEGVGDKEILENHSSQDNIVVLRIMVRRNNEQVPTNTFMVTFST